MIARKNVLRQSVGVMKTPMCYDIIADVHGRFDKLSALMERLGYRRDGDSFVPPPGRTALFLGDLIDTKPGHPYPGGVRSVLRAVKVLCDRGHAQVLMGNHELNALYFHSRGPHGWLRVRGRGNIAQHQGTLDDFPDYDDPASEWQQVWLPWMKRLPMALDFGDFRAVHATWHEGMLQRIAGQSFESEDFFFAAVSKCNPEGEAVETLLKGVEIELPRGLEIADASGIMRPNLRVKWWELPGEISTYRDLAFHPDPAVPDVEVSAQHREQIPGYPADAPPVFFGHYLKSAASPLLPERHNVACLDHAAAKDGPLVAYRWQGEERIKPEHYVVSSSHHVS